MDSVTIPKKRIYFRLNSDSF